MGIKYIIGTALITGLALTSCKNPNDEYIIRKQQKQIAAYRDSLENKFYDDSALREAKKLIKEIKELLKDTIKYHKNKK